MKTTILKISSIVFVFVMLASIAITPSCKKDKTCHGTVHVVDTNGTAVSNATILLFVTGGDVTYNGVSDGSGDAAFEVTLPAIFDVKATKGSLVGLGVLRLDEAGKEDAVTITIN